VQTENNNAILHSVLDQSSSVFTVQCYEVI